MLHNIDQLIEIIENLNNSTTRHKYNAYELESILYGNHKSQKEKGKHLYGGVISRQTIKRWIKKGIIPQHDNDDNSKDDNEEYFEVYKNRTYIDTIELLDTLKRIRETKN
jgi:hypothetical protein